LNPDLISKKKKMRRLMAETEAERSHYRERMQNSHHGFRELCGCE
jgi:hypothetical protein